MRFFNTAGPVEAARHYCLPPLSRIDLDEVLRLIDQAKYFVLHAPRQTGKTSVLLALMDHLNREGRYACLYTNVEAAQALRGDVAQAMPIILTQIAARAETYLGETRLRGWVDELLRRNTPGGRPHRAAGTLGARERPAHRTAAG